MLLMDKILMALKNARNQIHTLGTPDDEVNNAHLTELDGIVKVLEEPNPDNDFFYWTLEIGIHKIWVADGADFTDQRAHDMIAKHFGWAYGHELKAKVLGKPLDEAVAAEMGFKSAADYRKDRRKE